VLHLAQRRLDRLHTAAARLRLGTEQLREFLAQGRRLGARGRLASVEPVGMRLPHFACGEPVALHRRLECLAPRQQRGDLRLRTLHALRRRCVGRAQLGAKRIGALLQCLLDGRACCHLRHDTLGGCT
jgi:hypothetical protein